MMTFLHIVLYVYLAGVALAFFVTLALAYGRMRFRFALLLAAEQAWMFFFTITGWWLLVIPCLGAEWAPCSSDFERGRTIDRWAGFWYFLNWLGYHNGEDGDSGLQARVSTGNFMPNAVPAVRGYCWSAWRNPANGWGYWLHWRGKTIPARVNYTLGPLSVQVGWRSVRWDPKYYVPVLSLSRN